MASRQIAITIKVINSEAVTSIKAQTAAQSDLSLSTQKLSQLQAGLSSSFVKGNLAARAISITYLAIRDSLKFAISEGIEYEHLLTKLGALTGASAEVTSYLSDRIQAVAGVTRQSQLAIAGAAIEMGKLGLSGSQTAAVLESVAKLARGLDEDVVTVGTTVVQVLNAYGKSTDEANKITNELAFTVRASALDMESFRTAFSYVGATAKAAGVSFEELQATMDVLSNSGIRASTIGTQLRRIIIELSNEHSRASQLIGGTIQSYGGLANALAALADKHLTVSDYAALFGKTAASVSQIVTKYTDEIHRLNDETGSQNGLVDELNSKMNTTLKSSLDGIASSWGILGATIMKSNGPLKLFLDQIKLAIDTLTAWEKTQQDIKAFEQFDPAQAKIVKDRASTSIVGGILGPLFGGNNQTQNIQEDPAFQKFLQIKKEKEQLAVEIDDIVNQIKNTLSSNLPALQKTEAGGAVSGSVENTFLFKKLFNDYLGAGHTKEEFRDALKHALDKKISEIKPEETESKVMPKGAKGKPYRLHGAQEYAVYGTWDTFEGQRNGEGARNLDFPYRKIDQKESSKVIAQAEHWDSLLKQTKKDWQAYTLAGQASILMQQQFGQVIDQTIQKFSVELVDSLARGKNSFKDFGDFFGDIVKNILAQITQLLIKFALLKLAMSFATSGGTGFGNFLVSALGGPNFATGTDQMVNKPTMFMAGESGPERVKVTPTAKRGSEDRQEAIVINVHGDVYDGDRFAHKVKQAIDSHRGRYV